MTEVYWIRFDHDIPIVVNGCEMTVRKPGGTVVLIDLTANPDAKARFMSAHPEGIHLNAPEHASEI